MADKTPETLTKEEAKAQAERMMHDHVARMYEEEFEGLVEGAATRLERMAADIREWRFAVRFGQRRTALDRAAHVMNELTWGMANMGAQRLIDAAGQADTSFKANEAYLKEHPEDIGGIDEAL